MSSAIPSGATTVPTDSDAAGNGHQSVDDLSRSLQRFNWPDYMVFVMMLISCIFIGIYFGYKDHQKHKNRKTARRDSEALDYLVGGRKMSVFPVSVSLVARCAYDLKFKIGFDHFLRLLQLDLRNISAGNLDGNLRVRYAVLLHRVCDSSHGIRNALHILAGFSRFADNICLRVSGVNIHVITPIVCLVCIFYTSVGGLKAVVWTDVIQTTVMVGAMIIVIVKGTMDVGGLGVVIERNSAGQRLEKPIFDLDPTARNTFWNLFIGGAFFWTSTNATNQNMIQRYLSLPTLKAARRALILFLFGTTAVLSLCCYNGLLIYAMHHDCDPLSTGLAKAKDQLVPLLVMEVLAIYPGLAGLFVAGIFSAALSSLSTALNSLSAIVLEDFCKPFVKKPLTEFQVRYLMRASVLVFGTIAVILVVVVEKMGAVLQLSMSLGPVTLGPLFGLFIMGMFFPRINGTCAIIGAAGGLLTMSYIVIRSQISIALGEITFAEKPVTVEGCAYDFTPLNKTITFPTDGADSHVEKSLHHVSFLYYTLIGSMVPTIIGYLCAVIKSFTVGYRPEELDIDPLLLAPFLRKYQKPSKTAHMAEVIHEFETKDVQL
ncbi:sodium/solute symporter [Culex quinquefasciatus]|uniref:Sodium/solute symporter n=1 Tax=Culex quinquefasciatus TaxID=7176 RepID=B0W668_CULQU|nr:sodium/solute symporter [Culex quinquefasciatus]|eukprot:XP_001844202.1 sodium/solute symporter [Culex quinquefasciatus]